MSGSAEKEPGPKGLAPQRRALRQPRIAWSGWEAEPRPAPALFASLDLGGAVRGGSATTLFLLPKCSTLTLVGRGLIHRIGKIRGVRIACRGGLLHCLIGSG